MVRRNAFTDSLTAAVQAIAQLSNFKLHFVWRVTVGVVCCSAQAELTGLLLYLVWFGHVVLLLPPAPDGTNLLFGVRQNILLPFLSCND